jgi:hypothetical protein
MKIEEKEELAPENEGITLPAEDTNAPIDQAESIEENQQAAPVADTPVKQEKSKKATVPKAKKVSAARKKVSDKKASEQVQPEAVISEKKDVDTTGVIKKEVETEDAQGSDSVSEQGDQSFEVETEQHLDYSNYNKKQLVQVLESLAGEDNFSQIGRILKETKKAYDDLHADERKAAYDKYIEDGGEKDGFEYKLDELDQRFQKAHDKLRDRRNQFLNNLEASKEDNLQKKQALLDRLRDLVDSEETGSSLKVLKDIQTKWREIGPVPPAQLKNLWANYNALLDRFYDNRSIYFELKELDRKKNYDLKIELCERAEQLASGEDLGELIRQLNDLHEEFKHIGPVPAEVQDVIWERFKTASDKIYIRRKEHYEILKESLRANLVAKEAISEKIAAFSSFESDRIAEWNEKTKEIIQLQKEWESIGGIPKEKAKKVNKQFWSAFKAFFGKKGAFFKKIEEERKENLRMKQELLDKAEALKDSEDFRSASEELKKLQVRWKEIGPVPEKFRNEIFNKFKKACDHFFSRRRSKSEHTEQEYNKNLAKKTALCGELEELSKTGKVDMARVKAIESEWAEIGFVPKENIKSIQRRYTEAIEKITGAVGISENEKYKLRFMAQFNPSSYGPGADRMLQKKEGVLRRKISTLENDINVWKNNIDFFTSSKNADRLKREFQVKIDEANAELKNLKEQLKVISNI